MMNMEKRLKVLKSSLMLESLVSTFLAGILDIKDHIHSISFGNRSSALSFNQKINLLIDIGAIERNDRTKYVTLMEIRNQFMHNLECDTFEKCLDVLEGKETYLLKLYPQMEEDREQRLINCFNALSAEVIKTTHEILKVITQRIADKAQHSVISKSHDLIHEAIKEGTEYLDKVIEDFIKGKTMIPSKDMANIGRTTMQIIYTKWKKGMANLNS